MRCRNCFAASQIPEWVRNGVRATKVQPDWGCENEPDGLRHVAQVHQETQVMLAY
jgi:hypothetical protein